MKHTNLIKNILTTLCLSIFENGSSRLLMIIIKLSQIVIWSLTQCLVLVYWTLLILKIYKFTYNIEYLVVLTAAKNCSKFANWGFFYLICWCSLLVFFNFSERSYKLFQLKRHFTHEVWSSCEINFVNMVALKLTNA